MKTVYSLYGLDVTQDEQIVNWIQRTNGKYRKLQFPKTIDGMVNVNTMTKSCNFLRSLDIAAINNEIRILHPYVHEFWEEEKIRTDFFEFLAVLSKFLAVISRKPVKRLMVEAKYVTDVEEGFVDGHFKLYKLRKETAKARCEIMVDSAVSTYNHKFATHIFGNQMDYRSSLIESLIEPKRIEFDNEKRMEASVIAYELFVLQHAALKCILETHYEQFINVTIYNKFIETHLVRRQSQCKWLH